MIYFIFDKQTSCCKNIKHLIRKKTYNQAHNQNFFKTREVSGKILEFFLLDTVKTTFRMKNLTQIWAQSGPFFPKLSTFFDFRKRAGEASFLDNRLSWENHISHLNLKLIRGIGILTKLRKFVSKDILKLQYFAFAQSHIDYGLILGGNYELNHKENCTKLEESSEKDYLKVIMPS